MTAPGKKVFAAERSVFVIQEKRAEERGQPLNQQVNSEIEVAAIQIFIPGLNGGEQWRIQHGAASRKMNFR